MYLRRNTYTQIVVILIMLIFFLRVAVSTRAGVDIPGPINSLPGSPWYLTFQDEFDDLTLNRNKWITGRPDTHPNDGHGQLQVFVDDAFEFQNGYIRIKAEKRDYQGFAYTSGYLESRKSFIQKYGYFEMRARMAQGQGMWSSFWMLNPEVDLPEIDVVETLGQTPNLVRTNYHWKNMTTGQHETNSQRYQSPDLTKDFHVYGLEWSPDRLIWYFDGKQIATQTIGVSQANIPMMLILDLAVGGDWPGPPTVQTPFPNYFDIDYVRAWQRSKDSTPEPTATPPVACNGTIIEAESGALTGDFKIGTDNNARAGAYVYTPNTIASTYNGVASSHSGATYCFNVLEAGKYRIIARVRAQNSNENSFFIRVDGMPENGHTWDFAPLDGSWHEDYVRDTNVIDPMELSLDAGNHYVEFYMRESGAQLDSIWLERVDTPTATPSMMLGTPTATIDSNIVTVTPMLAPTTVTTTPIIDNSTLSVLPYKMYLPFTQQVE